MCSYGGQKYEKILQPLLRAQQFNISLPAASCWRLEFRGTSSVHECSGLNGLQDRDFSIEVSLFDETSDCVLSVWGKSIPLRCKQISASRLIGKAEVLVLVVNYSWAAPGL